MGFSNTVRRLIGQVQQHRASSQVVQVRNTRDANNRPVAFVDRDGDGVYSAGRDQQVLIDLNKDGQISDEEIRHSGVLLGAAADPNFLADFDGDGVSTAVERVGAQRFQHVFMRGADRDQDGVFSGQELSDAGFTYWTDRNENGRIDPGHSGPVSLAHAVEFSDAGGSPFSHSLDVRNGRVDGAPSMDDLTRLVILQQINEQGGQGDFSPNTGDIQVGPGGLPLRFPTMFHFMVHQIHQHLNQQSRS